MSKSKIEWTDRVWNPVTGCTKVSPGCANCYAERMAIRMKGRFGYPHEHPFNVTLHYERLNEPSRWRKPAKIFVCSMSDLFHKDVDSSFIYTVLETAAVLPRHIFMILTKRPDRMFEFYNSTSNIFSNLPNVWLGVSAENQQTADERIPILLQIPAAVRFVSCEPLLGSIDLSQWLKANSQQLNWVIAGGESGPGARPMHPDWVRSLRDQCQAAGVPFFFKQWGEWGLHGMRPAHKRMIIHDGWPVMSKMGKKAAGRLLDGREWNEFPEAKTIPV